VIINRHSINNVDVLEIDVDPITPPGAQAKVGSVAIVQGGGFWQKSGPYPLDWIKLNANIKSGNAAIGSWVGSPKKSSVVFDRPFPSANYSVHVSGVSDSRAWTIESRTISGFVINSNANAFITGDIFWTAKLYEEVS
jgi:hypothetical protein